MKLIALQHAAKPADLVRRLKKRVIAIDRHVLSLDDILDFADRCWREEIFGPVVCIVPFEDEEKMIRDVNASPYGLSGSLWTNNLQRALRLSRRIESGVLSINSHSSVHVEAPFGGFKRSGIGRDLGMTAMEGYTEVKNIYVAD